MTYPRNIDHVVFGQYDIVTWFYSPYPEEFVPTGKFLSKLFVCPRCFKYTANESAASGHQVRAYSFIFTLINDYRHFVRDRKAIQVA